VRTDPLNEEQRIGLPHEAETGREIASEQTDHQDSALARLARLAEEASAVAIAADARELSARLLEGRFYLAVVGQFKRGKSTLINALVGDAVLPAGVAPVTALVTVVRHGLRRGARVRFQDGLWRDIEPAELPAFVSEEGNPENAKNVTGVEVFVPSALLASGMCLVDTPGLGSVFTSGTAATHEFVPHVDAALLVLGADPPISEDELALAETIARQVHEIVVVLNKADRASPPELREARAFTEQVLARRLGRDPGAVLEVSAAERLASGIDTREWGALHGALVRLAHAAGGSVVAAAERRGLERLTARLRRDLDEEREALIRPVEESRLRIDALRRCALDAERAMRELGYLLTAEQDRLREIFAERKDVFVRRTLEEARRELFDAARELGKRGPAARREAIALAQEISRRWLDRWRVEEQPAAEALYRQAADRFVRLADEFLERLRRSGDPALARLPAGVGPELGFRVKSGLYYSDLWSHAGGYPLRGLVDLFRTRASMQRTVEREVGRYLETLLYTNATRVENDFNERVLESRRRLETEVRSSLKEVYASAERSLERAQAARAAGDKVVEASMERLESLRARLDDLAAQSLQGECS
jgi:GTP-binding protein EngB required for normal cell division